jgi:DNA methylase
MMNTTPDTAQRARYALTIPSPTQLAPDGFAEIVRGQLAQITDIAKIEKGHRELLALEKYVYDKGQRNEVRIAARWCEVRIGELLGPPEQTWPGKNASLAGEVLDHNERHKFRLLATNQHVVVESIAQGRTSRTEILRDIRRAHHADSGSTAEISGFVAGDFRDVALTLADESVSLIFTDPPYARSSLPLYEALAETGARVLRDGASLLCYCGQYLIPDVLNVMTPHLRFWWVCAVEQNKRAQMREYGVMVHWKPILWLVKGTRADTQTFVDDLAVGERDKDSHDWQQSMVEAAYYISRLNPESGLVFDPFCGSGTTAVACRDLGYKFLTCDVDVAALSVAKARFQS